MTTLPSPDLPLSSSATAPADTVIEFLRALAAYDVDAALDLVADDLVYSNVSLPTIYGQGHVGAHGAPVAAPGTDGLQRPPQPRGDRGRCRVDRPDRRAELGPLRHALLGLRPLHRGRRGQDHPMARLLR